MICGTEEQAEAVRFVQNAAGSIMSPFVAWLTLQGCKTLSVRMDAQSAAALEIARHLESHPKVERVIYPGLASFPQHALASRQASGYGAMVCCEVRGGLEAGKRMMDAVELWSLAENLGTVESLVTHPVSMTHANFAPEERARLGITDGLIRLSVGIETPADPHRRSRPGPRPRLKERTGERPPSSTRSGLASRTMPRVIGLAGAAFQT